MKGDGEKWKNRTGGAQTFIVTRIFPSMWINQGIYSRKREQQEENGGPGSEVGTRRKSFSVGGGVSSFSSQGVTGSTVGEGVRGRNTQ